MAGEKKFPKSFQDLLDLPEEEREAAFQNLLAGASVESAAKAVEAGLVGRDAQAALRRNKRIADSLTKNYETVEGSSYLRPKAKDMREQSATMATGLPEGRGQEFLDERQKSREAAQSRVNVEQALRGVQSPQDLSEKELAEYNRRKDIQDTGKANLEKERQSRMAAQPSGALLVTAALQRGTAETIPIYDDTGAEIGRTKTYRSPEEAAGVQGTIRSADTVGMTDEAFAKTKARPAGEVVAEGLAAQNKAAESGVAEAYWQASLTNSRNDPNTPRETEEDMNAIWAKGVADVRTALETPGVIDPLTSEPDPEVRKATPAKTADATTRDLDAKRKKEALIRQLSQSTGGRKPLWS
jgi:hypothetical protein